MIFPFEKPVAKPTSDAIQARRAMADHGSSIILLSSRSSVLRSGAIVHHNRTQVGASRPEAFHRARRAFLTSIPVDSGRRSQLCFPSYIY